MARDVGARLFHTTCEWCCGSDGDDTVELKSPDRRTARTRMMDMSWVTDRIAVGGGIWTEDKMIEVARAGITHIIDMQIEFDDTALAEPYGVEVLWNAVDDDFQPKPPEIFKRGVDFAMDALEDESTKIYIHCAAGVHRAPMMTLALLGALGWKLEDAKSHIAEQRPVVDFADVYVRSVERFLQTYTAAEPARTSDSEERK